MESKKNTHPSITKYKVQVIDHQRYRTVLTTVNKVKAAMWQLSYERLGYLARTIEKEVK